MRSFNGTGLRPKIIAPLGRPTLSFSFSLSSSLPLLASLPLFSQSQFICLIRIYPYTEQQLLSACSMLLEGVVQEKLFSTSKDQNKQTFALKQCVVLEGLSPTALQVCVPDYTTFIS